MNFLVIFLWDNDEFVMVFFSLLIFFFVFVFVWLLMQGGEDVSDEPVSL